MGFMAAHLRRRRRRRCRRRNVCSCEALETVTHSYLLLSLRTFGKIRLVLRANKAKPRSAGTEVKARSSCAAAIIPASAQGRSAVYSPPVLESRIIKKLNMCCLVSESQSLQEIGRICPPTPALLACLNRLTTSTFTSARPPRRASVSNISASLAETEAKTNPSSRETASPSSYLCAASERLRLLS